MLHHVKRNYVISMQNIDDLGDIEGITFSEVLEKSTYCLLGPCCNNC